MFATYTFWAFICFAQFLSLRCFVAWAVGCCVYIFLLFSSFHFTLFILCHRFFDCFLFCSCIYFVLQSSFHIYIFRYKSSSTILVSLVAETCYNSSWCSLCYCFLKKKKISLNKRHSDGIEKRAAALNRRENWPYILLNMCFLSTLQWVCILWTKWIIQMKRAIEGKKNPISNYKCLIIEPNS